MGARAQLSRSMGDLPGPGILPVSCALTSGFLTTGPPGKSPCSAFLSDSSCPYSAHRVSLPSILPLMTFPESSLCSPVLQPSQSPALPHPLPVDTSDASPLPASVGKNPSGWELAGKGCFCSKLTHGVLFTLGLTL